MFVNCHKQQIHTQMHTNGKSVYVGPLKTGRPSTVCLAPEIIEVLKKPKTEQLRTKIDKS